MKRATRILTKHQDDVTAALDRFGDHEDMSEARVVRWLEQFRDSDIALAVQIVRAVRYLNAANLRAMTKQFFQIAIDELRDQGHERVVFLPVGDAGSGSSTVARVLRERVKGTRHQMLSMVDLINVTPGSIGAIVFVDDFSGTGMTLEEWWKRVEALVLPTGATVFVGLLVLNGQARGRIEQFADVVAVEELDISDNVFSDQNNQFSAEQKVKLLEYCQRTGCGPDFERGFGNCGLLLAFKHGCPNNSLPVLWYSKNNWRPFFNRRAI